MRITSSIVFLMMFTVVANSVFGMNNKRNGNFLPNPRPKQACLSECSVSGLNKSLADSSALIVVKELAAVQDQLLKLKDQVAQSSELRVPQIEQAVKKYLQPQFKTLEHRVNELEQQSFTLNKIVDDIQINRMHEQAAIKETLETFLNQQKNLTKIFTQVVEQQEGILTVLNELTSVQGHKVTPNDQTNIK